MAAVDVGARPGDLQAEQYDQAEADFWRDLDIPGAQETVRNDNALQTTLNMDEEIKVTKKRKPVAKLDAERLLSERGIPELRRRAAKRVKLSSKGNEFEDIGKLLQMYQMWLDDMFPKAKFRDGLAMIEKVGHTKRLNVMRREWIASTRPIVRNEEQESDREFEAEKEQHDDGRPSDEQQDDGVPSDEPTQDVPEHPAEDDLDLLLNEEQGQQSQHPPDDLEALLVDESTRPQSAKRTKAPFDDDDDEDELDALLAAEPAEQSTVTAPANEFADDEEAMNEMGVW